MLRFTIAIVLALSLLVPLFAFAGTASAAVTDVDVTQPTEVRPSHVVPGGSVAINGTVTTDAASDSIEVQVTVGATTYYADLSWAIAGTYDWQVIYPDDFDDTSGAGGAAAPALADTNTATIVATDGVDDTDTETDAISCTTAQLWINPHMGGATGGFGTTPDGCAGCHRAHTAQGEYLLTVGGTRTNFCYSCHESGTGAYTDVANGMYLGSDDGATNDGLRGGGFDLALMDTDLDGTATLDDVTSLHNTSSTGVTMWGFGAGAGTSVDFECTSCHNPHGNDCYRILRPRPANSMGLTNGVEVSPIDDQWLWGKTISATDDAGAAITIEDVDGWANGPNAVDYAFNNETSTITANFGDDDAQVLYSAIEDGVNVPTSVDLEVRFAATGTQNGTADTINLDIYDGSAWTNVASYTLATAGIGTMDTYSYVVSGTIDDLTKLNAAQVRLIGIDADAGEGSDDSIALEIDEIRLNVGYAGGGGYIGTDKAYTITYDSATDERIVTYSPKLINAWCAQCHSAYLAGADAGHTAGTSPFSYRHMTGSLTEGSAGTVDDEVGFSQGCLKCHVAHGTSAAMDNYSGSVPWPDAAISPDGDARSSLLHIDNRGVCTQCHSSANLAAN